jgi:transposase
MLCLKSQLIKLKQLNLQTNNNTGVLTMKHTILNFINQHFFVGIDVHLRQWKVTIRSAGVELKTFSMHPLPSELIDYLNKHYPGGIYHIAYEAGFCGFWIQRAFTDAAIHCIVVHPADIPSSGKEKAVKTDAIDSRKLARQLEQGNLKAVYVPSVASEQLRSLMRLRFKLVQHQTRLKNRIKGTLRFSGIVIPPQHLTNSRWSGAFILWLKSVSLPTDAGRFTFSNLIVQLEQTRKHLANVLRQLHREAAAPEIAPALDAIQSSPGIAFVSAMTLFTEIIDIKRFHEFENLCSFVGLVPSLYSSGDTAYTRGMTFRHNHYLRPLLIETAWTAVSKDPAMTLRFNELCRTMSKQMAIIRIAKKLLRRIFHLWKNQDRYVYALVA